MGSRVVFLDLETTGANFDRDRIAEIGLLEVVDGQLVSEWSTLVNPGRALSTVMTSLTGITEQMLASAPTFTEIASELLERLEDHLLVAHNARFDYAFLRAEFRRLGIRFRSRVLCTVRLSRVLFPEHRHHNLDSVIARFGLTCAARHRALGDAQVVWAFTRALERLVGFPRLSETVSALTQLPALPAGVDAERFEDLPDAPGVYVFYGTDGKALYVGKSTNLRARVLAHFERTGRLDREHRVALSTASLEWVETGGELGAALREIRLLRELAPVFNRRRDPSTAWSLRWSPGSVVDPAELDIDADVTSESHYGVFRSRADAFAALRGVAQAQQLCRIQLGLESGPGPCSAYAAGICRGACIGRETSAQHMIRLAGALARLRQRSWPFPGRVGWREEDPYRGVSEIHVLDRWRYLGSARSETELADLQEQCELPPLDIDHYKLLVRHLLGARSPLPLIDMTRGG